MIYSYGSYGDVHVHAQVDEANYDISFDSIFGVHKGAVVHSCAAAFFVSPDVVVEKPYEGLARGAFFFLDTVPQFATRSRVGLTIFFLNNFHVSGGRKHELHGAVAVAVINIVEKVGFVINDVEDLLRIKVFRICSCAGAINALIDYPMHVLQIGHARTGWTSGWFRFVVLGIAGPQTFGRPSLLVFEVFLGELYAFTNALVNASYGNLLVMVHGSVLGKCDQWLYFLWKGAVGCCGLAFIFKSFFKHFVLIGAILKEIMGDEGEDKFFTKTFGSRPTGAKGGI